MVLYEVGRLRRNEMEDLVFIKTENAFGKFCFCFRYQISGKSKNKKSQSMVDLETDKSASTVVWV